MSEQKEQRVFIDRMSVPINILKTAGSFFGKPLTLSREAVDALSAFAQRAAEVQDYLERLRLARNSEDWDKIKPPSWLVEASRNEGDTGKEVPKQTRGKRRKKSASKQDKP